MKQLAFCVALAAFLLALLAGPAAAAAAPQLVLAVVDYQRLQSDYRGMQDANREFQDLMKQHQDRIQQHYKTRLLSAAEKQEFLDLTTTAAPTEARDQRLADLQQLSNTREQRLMELSQNKERKPEEEEEYQQLNSLYQAGMAELGALQTELDQERQAKGDELLKQVNEAITKAVNVIAQEKKLTLVLHKEVVLFGGLDITDEVLAKLNAADTAPK